MSKIGKKPIIVPEGVEVIIEKELIKIKGPKGELSQKFLDCVNVKKEDNTIVLSIKNEEHKNFRGSTRSLIENMVEGVTKSYEKKLIIMGVGYGAQIQGNKLVLSLGLSHKINYDIPQGVTIQAEQNQKGHTILTLNSIDKQFLGEVAAKIRSYKKPEPYKGKGIRYIDEIVKLKAGKSSAK